MVLCLYADCLEALPGFGTGTHRKLFGASVEILTGCRRKRHSEYLNGISFRQLNQRE